MDLWRKFSPVYVVLAVTLFVYLMSRNLVYTAVALVIFGALAYALRQKPGAKPVPIMLAIAAVTFSTMHQSSLGSLFLLMPDKLNHLWWSPILPLYFFLSSVAAGLALVILMNALIAKVFKRPLPKEILAKMGKYVLVSLAVYLAVRVVDLVIRGEFGHALFGPGRELLWAELFFGGVLPLILLATAKLRARPGLLILGTLLAAGGVVFNRCNVVLFAMNLTGPMPGVAPTGYYPSLVEIAVSVSLVAATFFLFSLGAKILPVLPGETGSKEPV
jgi:formate dehydrogenase iron-sulfur subunit